MTKNSKAIVQKVFIALGYFIVFAGPQIFILMIALGCRLGWIEGNWMMLWFTVWLFCSYGCAYGTGYLLFGAVSFEKMTKEDWQYHHTEVDVKYDSSSSKLTFDCDDIYVDKNGFVRFLILTGLALLLLVGGVVVFIVKLIMLILA